VRCFTWPLWAAAAAAMPLPSNHAATQPGHNVRLLILTPCPPALGRRMAQHRLAIGDAIFDRGAEGLAALVCVQRFAVCQPHHISEGGEAGEL